MNDYGEYDKATRTSRSDNDDNNFFQKYQVSYIYKTTKPKRCLSNAWVFFDKEIFPSF